MDDEDAFNEQVPDDEAVVAAQQPDDEDQTASAQENPQKEAAEETSPAQSGRAQNPALKFRSFHVTQKGRKISKVTLYCDGVTKVKKRPADDSPEAVVWSLLEKQTVKLARARSSQDALKKIEAVLLTHHATHSATHNAINTSNADHTTNTTNAEAPGIMPAPETPLPKDAIAEIERRYFLTIQEDTHASDGRPFAACGKSGSLCGHFPHFISTPSRSRFGTAQLYGVSQQHRIGLRVQLMQRVNDGEPIKASEFELLKFVHKHYSATQLAKFGHFEQTLTIFASLEFANGTPVTAENFKVPPPEGAMWSPPESPACHAGVTERVMESGVVNFRKLWLNKRVTTANIDEDQSDFQFRIAVTTLHPLLQHLTGFNVKSLPFVVKAVKHNDVEKKERYVCTPSGDVVPLK